MNLEKFGVQELTDFEKTSIGGGQKAKYMWYSGNNSLIYFGYAVYNGGVSVYNWFN